mmetsp:Transcript_82261/g.233242  ORF Transcript_82261/g.233242 Transcript_82261/m.233242 type:complete len:397 (-) Transcript_82261:1697-2887(-)
MPWGMGADPGQQRPGQHLGGGNGGASQTAHGPAAGAPDEACARPPRRGKPPRARAGCAHGCRPGRLDSRSACSAACPASVPGAPTPQGAGNCTGARRGAPQPRTGAAASPAALRKVRPQRDHGCRAGPAVLPEELEASDRDLRRVVAGLSAHCPQPPRASHQAEGTVCGGHSLAGWPPPSGDGAAWDTAAGLIPHPRRARGGAWSAQGGHGCWRRAAGLHGREEPAPQDRTLEGMEGQEGSSGHGSAAAGGMARAEALTTPADSDRGAAAEACCSSSAPPAAPPWNCCCCIICCCCHCCCCRARCSLSYLSMRSSSVQASSSPLASATSWKSQMASSAAARAFGISFPVMCSSAIRISVAASPRMYDTSWNSFTASSAVFRASGNFPCIICTWAKP